MLLFVILGLFVINIYWARKSNRSKERYMTPRNQCDQPVFYGRSKCYSCDIDLARRYCHARVDDNGDNLEREVSTNLLPAGPNAKLGYMDT